MELIKSYLNDNAVKVIAFAINYTQQLSNETITTVIQTLKDTSFFTEKFQDIKDQNMFSMTVNPDGVQAQTQSIGGVVCNNDDWSLTVNKDVIIVTCKKYTRWNDISSETYQYLNEIFKLIPSTQGIAQITLEYLDEFEILDNKSDWKRYLFNKECSYITDNIYETADFWHINLGSFVELKELDQKLLDGIDINYFADEQDELKHKINLRTQHVLSYAANQAYNNKIIEKNFNTMHIHSKEVFEKIIHSDILKKFKQGDS